MKRLQDKKYCCDFFLYLDIACQSIKVNRNPQHSRGRRGTGRRKKATPSRSQSAYMPWFKKFNELLIEKHGVYVSAFQKGRWTVNTKTYIGDVLDKVMASSDIGFPPISSKALDVPEYRETIYNFCSNNNVNKYADLIARVKKYAFTGMTLTSHFKEFSQELPKFEQSSRTKLKTLIEEKK
jgi:hypothetical protein